MSSTSLYNHLCHFQSENVFQIPAINATKRTIFDIQATISLKNRQFDEHRVTKSTSTGKHTEAQ